VLSELAFLAQVAFEALVLALLLVLVVMARRP